MTTKGVCYNCRTSITEDEFHSFCEKTNDGDTEISYSDLSDYPTIRPFLLCEGCIQVCYECDCILNLEEQHEYYCFEPCGLDKEWYKNKDTKSNPYCSNCYDNENIYDMWMDYDRDGEEEEEEEEEEDEEEEEEEESIPYPPLPPSPQEPKIELPKDTKKMWDHQLTLDDLNTSVNKIPKTRIQEENVRYGMAYCANETKEKSVKKLREYLEKHPNPKYVEEKSPAVCTVLVDGSTSLSFPYPKGKTQKDLLNYLYDFFN